MSSMNGDIRSFVVFWNNKYPLDRWWREKYKIPFGSDQHLSQNIMDMRFDFEEEYLVKKAQIQQEIEELDRKNKKYTPGHGSIFVKKKPKQMSEEEVDSAFDNLDVSKIEENDDGTIMI